MKVTKGTILVTAILGVIIAVLIRKFIVSITTNYHLRQQESLSSKARQDVRRHRAIVDFSFLGPNNLSDRLASRATPNERLTEAFGIQNSFTTTCPTIYTHSVTTARSVIQTMDSNKWIDFFHVAEAVLDRVVNPLGEFETPVYLVTIVRPLVFIAMLHPFFSVEPTQISLDDVGEATDMINLLWMESKKTSRTGLHEYQQRLQAALQRILPHCFPCRQEKHPLNIIIPAYETMWRVVLLTYVSAGFRVKDRETAEQFRQVVEDCPRYFNKEIDSDVLEVALNFAKEGLRLYPPTKRIRRTAPSDPLNVQGDPHVVAADVEKCHRDARIWGPDAKAFRPSRFRELTDAMKEAYMPFGAGKHQCPTASKFGYRAIIVLVVALAKGLGTLDSGLKIRFDNAELDENLSEVLPSGRMDTEDWVCEMNFTDAMEQGNGGEP
ncbi:cytochrome P450 [Hypoxylon sp. NC0597]|nr:cytochrome P450 [Hypoxylon sp. NC0597]